MKASDVSNKYTYDYGTHKYRQNSCLFQGLLKGIQDYCNCIPRYIDDIEDYIQGRFETKRLIMQFQCIKYNGSKKRFIKYATGI